MLWKFQCLPWCVKRPDRWSRPCAGSPCTRRSARSPPPSGCRSSRTRRRGSPCRRRNRSGRWRGDRAWRPARPAAPDCARAAPPRRCRAACAGAAGEEAQEIERGGHLAVAGEMVLDHEQAAIAELLGVEHVVDERVVGLAVGHSGPRPTTSLRRRDRTSSASGYLAPCRCGAGWHAGRAPCPLSHVERLLRGESRRTDAHPADRAVLRTAPARSMTRPEMSGPHPTERPIAPPRASGHGCSQGAAAFWSCCAWAGASPGRPCGSRSRKSRPSACGWQASCSAPSP